MPQALFSQECPLLQKGLPAMLKLLYIAGTWSYLCAALTTPIFIAVPVIAVVRGIFPLPFTSEVAAAFVPYFLLMHTGEVPAPNTPLPTPGKMGQKKSFSATNPAVDLGCVPSMPLRMLNFPFHCK